jgi:hypothetical protein
MGQTTPYLGIYIPSAGETNYEQSFAAGMMNIDQHDHSGGPNKGVPITTSGLADFSVTYDKLNANVVDPLTGIGTKGAPFQNQIEMLGILKNLFLLSGVPSTGFVTMNGSAVAARTFQNSSTVTWTNANGGGNPSAAVDISGLSPIGVSNGGTGVTSLTPYAVVAGGTGATTPVQQVSGLGTSGQVLTSNGAAQLPTWQTPTPFPTQNVQIAQITLTASQVRNLSGTPITLVAAQGAGTLIVPYTCYAKLNYGGVDTFHDGSSIRLYYGTGSTEVGFQFTSGSWKDNYNAYYYADDVRSSSSTGVAIANWSNRAVTISVNSSNFTGGNGNTVSIFMPYSVMTI